MERGRGPRRDTGSHLRSSRFCAPSRGSMLTRRQAPDSDVLTPSAVFSGHCHEGGYHFDESGLHHVTLVSPLENVGEEGAHAVVHVCGDRLEVQGGGKQKSMVLRYRG